MVPEGESGDSNPKYDALQLGTFFEEFRETEEVIGIIDNLANIYGDMISVELAVERFTFIIDQYQEQPHLLDPHLESLLEKLLNIVRKPATPDEVIHLAFKLLYLITKTRGYKVIVRLMPHEVADVEPVLALLDRQNPTDFQTWETRYLLMLWLSIVCMIPFDMCKLDSNVRANGDGEVRKPVMDRIIEVGKLYLDVTDKSRDAAGFMLSKFMTRPDVRKHKLPEFLDWTLVTIKNLDFSNTSGMMKISGILFTLALLFKHGKREDFVDIAPIVLKHTMSLHLDESSNTLLRKLLVKLTQRIGLTFLKARVAIWRYQRGSRSLADNLQQVSDDGTKAAATVEVEDEEYDIPEEMEEIIELLLTGLKDKDTIVRWSAAKGIGRMTGRLPRELADEVVGSIMELFTITETDASWHGGCLALAELGRRGLLLPQRLPDVVPVIIQALKYDEKRANFSVGAHVRDAACYVCWAFARAYDPFELKSHVGQISSALVIVSVFDREVNVRRAAAAAFQENVGRQGQFPHGIDILTTCDYFAVGNLKNCYLELSVFVAQFGDYTRALVDHLVYEKLSHWDIAIRELTSQSLHNLVIKDPEYFSQSILPVLLSKCVSMDLSLRHGAILAVGEVTHALAKLAHDQSLLSSFFTTTKMTAEIGDLIDNSSMEGLKNITNKLHEAQLFRGASGDLMRKAVCHLIEKLSSAKVPYHDDSIIDVWQRLIDECLQHVDPDIQAAATRAIPVFFSEYYIDTQGKALVKDGKNVQDEILERYLGNLKSHTETTRMGFCQALGAIPNTMLAGKVKRILTELTFASKLTKQDSKMAEARREAIKTITSLCNKLEVDTSEDANSAETLCHSNVLLVYKALFEALDDYTLDSRGDVGAWVREAAMTGLYSITAQLVRAGYPFSGESSNVVSKMMNCVAQQACEKIDRTRALAGELFSQLLYHSPEIPGIDHRTELKKIFPEDMIDLTNWAYPASTFPKFTALLSLESYSYNVLLGLTVSVGGLTESLVKYSAASLMSYLREVTQDKSRLESFTTVLLKVFTDHQKVDRITLPMFKMLDQLLSNGVFDLLAEEEGHTFPMDLFLLSKKEITKCGEPNKLLASISVFCDVLQFPGDVRKRSTSQLMIFLGHRFPIVRKTAATKLYEAIVTYDDVVGEDNLDEVMTLLSESQWDQPITEVKPIRNQLCELIGVKPPVLLKKEANNDKAE